MNHDYILIPNSSIEGIFWAAILSFFVSLINFKRTIGNYFLIVSSTFVLYLLINSGSRSGVIGFSSGMFYLLSVKNISSKIKSNFVGLCILCLSIAVFSLFFVKKGSSFGRLHIYDISANMFKEYWPYGIGIGRFKAVFNETQAKYFSYSNIDSHRALLADNTFYCFNDYFQLAIESGAIGLIILIAAFFILAKRIRILHRKENNAKIITSATACILCIAISALFSYPFQVKQIQLITIISLGIIAFYPNQKDNFRKTDVINDLSIKALYSILLVFFIFSIAGYINRKKLETEAFEHTQLGFKNIAAKKYKILIEKYPTVGYNYLSYAQLLYYRGDLQAALKTLQIGQNYYVDNTFYKLKADIENELGLYSDAEKSYLKSLYMVPNRMQSRLNLLTFYSEQKDTSNVIYWGNSILKMPIKIPSNSTQNILSKSREILTKFDNYKY